MSHLQENIKRIVERIFLTTYPPEISRVLAKSLHHLMQVENVIRDYRVTENVDWTWWKVAYQPYLTGTYVELNITLE